ncbi:hypothetical protein [Streptomyces katrae]|nr:hypothetical protein [Streptomyces katrae]
MPGSAYSDVRRLAHAIDAGRAITVEYVAASGSRTAPCPASTAS